MSKASDMRDRATSNPAALGTIGALTGAALGLALGKKAKNKREAEGFYEYGGGFRTEGGSYVSREFVGQPAYVPREGYSGAEVSTVGAESWSEPYREEQPWRSSGPEAGWSNVGYDREGYSGYGRTQGFQPGGEEPSRGEMLKGKASEFKGRASEKASELKDRMAHKASDVKQRLQERRAQGGEGPGFREKAAHLKERMPSGGELQQNLKQRPIGAIVGGLVLGAAAATLLPLTRKERRVMHPAKERVRSQIGEQVHHVEERFGFGEGEQQTPRRDWGAQGRQWRESRGRQQGQSQQQPQGGTYASSTSPRGGTFSSSAGSAGTSYSTKGVGAPTSGEVGRQPGSTYGGATSSAGTRGGQPTEGWSSGGKVESRDSIGAKSAADAPYRQPSLDQQLEEQVKDKDQFH